MAEDGIGLIVTLVGLLKQTAAAAVSEMGVRIEACLGDYSTLCNAVLELIKIYRMTLNAELSTAGAKLMADASGLLLGYFL
eukprot:2123511-Amphidinium_carterae.1